MNKIKLTPWQKEILITMESGKKTHPIVGRKNGKSRLAAETFEQEFKVKKPIAAKNCRITIGDQEIIATGPWKFKT